MGNEIALLSMPVSGGETVLPFDTWAQVKARARDGHSVRRIARELGLHRQTVRRVLSQEQPELYRRAPRPSILAPYEALVQTRAPAIGYNAWRLFGELQAQGYAGGYEMVKRAVRPLRQAERLLEEATIRFETAPGRQAQVDWSSTWLPCPEGRVRAQVFVMVLGYSRSLYVEFTADQRLETLLRCHEHAFDWFGGLTEEIVYDNPKTIVLHRSADGSHIDWQPVFWDFARYYGYLPRLCRPYRARTKGKVESGVKYVKRSFIPGRTGTDLEDWTGQAQAWIREVADPRVHGTTHARPVDRFSDERLRLCDGRPSYQLQTRLLRTVARDCFVTVETNRYSVPAVFIGHEVEVQWGPAETLRIYAQGRCIANHLRHPGRHQLIVEPAHLVGLPTGPDCVGGRSRLALGMEIEVRDLAVYEALAEGQP